MLKQLEQYLPAEAIAQIKAGAHKVLSYQLSRADNLPLTASRVGGIGYWPENQDYPRNEEGQALALLAQFNFSELPHHPDLPQSGLLAFYIDPSDTGYGINYDDPTDSRNTHTAYFADTNAPSLSREAQIALMSEKGQAYYQGREDEYQPDDTELAFRNRWQANAESVLQEWLARREDAVRHIDDYALNRLWQQEKSALPALAVMAKEIVADNNDELPLDWLTISSYLEDQYFAESNARVDTITGINPQSERWMMADNDYSEEEMAQEVYKAQILAQHIMTQGDPRWLQYWQHDPRAVITEDWQMQSELLDFYGVDTLSAHWQAKLPELYAQLDDIVARAQAQNIMGAVELDYLLEEYTVNILTPLREEYQKVSEDRRNEIRAFESQLLASRMERLAAKFAAQGFVAQGENVPDNMEDALRSYSQMVTETLEAQEEDNDNPFAALEKFMQGVSPLINMDMPENEAERIETAEKVQGYIAIMDEYVAHGDHPELVALWQTQREILQSTPPQSKVGFMMHGSFSTMQRWFIEQGVENPSNALLEDWLGFSLQGSGEDWNHPVEGEHAIQAELTTHYILFDNLEFNRHYGAELQEWVDGLGIDENAQRDLNDLIPTLVNHNHLLGTPFFTQWDPREEDDHENILLFQLDSSDDVWWGDSGIGQFFIRKADLQQRRFERAWFNWDCY